MNKNYKKNRGFTLIELMSVVAIVAILAAIALPLYNDYTTRTKISEGLNMASVAMLAVSEYNSTNSVLPTSNAQVGLPNAIHSPYVTSMTIAAGGVINVTFNAASGVTGGQDVVQYVPTVIAGGGISWACNGAGTSVPDQLLPPSCR